MEALIALQENDMVLLRGAPISGKSTVIKMLYASIQSSTDYWPIIIHSSHIGAYKTLKHVLVHSLGLPLWVSTAHDHVVGSVLREIDREAIGVVVILDDIDVFFFGLAAQYSEALKFLKYLSSNFTCIKFVGSFYEFSRLSEVVKGLSIDKLQLLDLKCRPSEGEFFKFLKYAVCKQGLKPVQFSDEGFQRALLKYTQGSTGLLIQTLKILAISGVLADEKVLTSQILTNLWRYSV